jgi:hypothetical protein
MKTADIRLALANEEAANARAGISQPHDVSASSLIVTGLELEETQ